MMSKKSKLMVRIVSAVLALLMVVGVFWGVIGSCAG